jgi:hypothetical protein
MQEPFANARRREADELVASVAGQTTHVARIARRRAGTLRAQATKWEKWVAEARRLGETVTFDRESHPYNTGFGPS